MIIRNSQEGDEAAVSLVSHALQDDYLIFALCRDLRIRMWSYKRQECLMSYSLLQQTHTTLKSHSNINGINYSNYCISNLFQSVILID